MKKEISMEYSKVPVLGPHRYHTMENSIDSIEENMARRVATLDDYKNKKQGSQGSDDDESEKYYAGGVDNKSGGGSGLNIVGPPKSSGNNPLDAAFQRASEAGRPPDDANPDDFTLITRYRNGFTVNDGPLRDYNSPESIQFLKDLDKGIVPRELAAANGGDISISLKDKSSEDFIPPAYTAFSKGTALGGVSKDPSSAFIFAEGASIMPIIDNAKPNTVLQIRLPDGRREKITVNHDTTILELCAVISNNLNINHSFILSSGYPPKDLMMPNQSIKDAGLIGAAVVLKKT